MSINIKNIRAAMRRMDVDTTRLDAAETAMREALAELESIPVQGRDRVDIMLGCMMAIEAMIGEEAGGDGQ